MRQETVAYLGQEIGRIRLTDVLGEGGMGAVYSGYDQVLQRKVAVKAIRSEFRFDEAAKARFLREARILSQLDHPAICRAYDFITGDEADFLVLEWVEGRNLREAIRSGLDPSDRMEIARQILSVLAEVHSQGVIHRDLKPENVMVTDDGSVKVLDFGIARSMDEEAGLSSGLTAAIVGGDEGADSDPADEPRVVRVSDSRGSALVRTRLGTVLGTVGYMSPEQALGEPATAASDMYSVGLVLQELFTGRRSYEEKLSDHELMLRSVDGESLPPEGLPSDLTALIVRLKSRVPGARPSSVDALEMLERIIDKPKRRRKAVLRTAVWTILAVFAIGMTVQSIRASKEAARAEREAAVSEQVAEFLVGLFRVADPQESRGETVTARELLDTGANRIETELAGQSGLQARLLFTMGRAYLELGFYDQAEELLASSLEHHAEADGGDPAERVTTLATLGALLTELGRTDEAMTHLQAALGLVEEGGWSQPADWAGVTGDIATAHLMEGQYSQAEELYLQVLAIEEAEHGVSSPEVADTLNDLGLIYRQLDRLDEAEPILRRVLAIDEATLGGDHPKVATAMLNLAAVLYYRDRYDECEELLLRALDLTESTRGPEHVYVADALTSLAAVYLATDRNQDGEAVLNRALDIYLDSYGEGHPSTASCLHNLAVVEFRLGDPAAAESLARRAIAVYEVTMGPDHPYIADPISKLAEICRAEGRIDEAIGHAERVLEIRQQSLPAGHPRVVMAIEDLAELYRAAGREELAAELEQRLPPA